MENDTRTPRDRINEEFMRKLMELDKANEENEMKQPQQENDAIDTMMCKGMDWKKDCSLSGRPLAMVYSPCQSWRELYEPDVGFYRGTIFKELDKPFYGDRRMEKRKGEEK